MGVILPGSGGRKRRKPVNRRAPHVFCSGHRAPTPYKGAKMIDGFWHCPACYHRKKLVQFSPSAVSRDATPG